MIIKHWIKKSGSFFIIHILFFVLFFSLNSAGAEEHKKWSRGLALGINMTQGNSDSFLLTTNLLAERQNGEIKRWRLGIDGSYGKTNEEKTAENALAFLVYRHGVTNNLYWSATGSTFVDTVAEVDYRLIIGPAIGYFLFRDIQSSLSVEIGPSYTREKIKNKPTEDYISARIDERFEQVLSETAKVWQSAEYLPDLRDSDNFLLNVEMGAEAALNSYLSLRITAQNKYDNEPADNKKKNDFSLVSSLNYKF